MADQRPKTVPTIAVIIPAWNEAATLPPTPQRRLFAGFQRYEYARNHLWHLAWSQLDATLIISGACSAISGVMPAASVGAGRGDTSTIQQQPTNAGHH